MLRTLQMEKRALLPRWEQIGRLLRPCAVTAAMFLLMHAELTPGASPLAAAMLAAVLIAGESAAACVLGCLLGMIRLPITECALLSPVSCALALMLQLLASLIPGEKLPQDAPRASLTAGLAVLLPGMAVCGGEAVQALLAFACSALAACAAPFFLALLRMEHARPNHEERLGLALLAGGCIAGLNLLFVPLGEITAVLLALLTGSAAPHAALISGIALLPGEGGMIRLAQIALLAPLCSRRLFPRSWQRSLAVLAAGLLMRLTLSGGLDLRWVLCAAAAYALIPEEITARLERALNPGRENPCDPSRIAREVNLDSQRRLNALADAFDIMAESDPGGYDVPDEQELLQQMRMRLCAGCIQYGACWAGEDNRAVKLMCRLIGDALERIDAPPGMRILFSDGEIPPDVLRVCRRGRMIPDRLGLLLRDFAEKRRSEIKRCETNHLLSLQLMQAAEILRDLARKSSSPGAEGLQGALEHLDPGMHALALGNSIALVKNAPWHPEEIRRACALLGRRLHTRFLAQAAGDSLRLSPMPRLQAETAACCQSGRPGLSCGDSHLIRDLENNRLLLAISDGMGSGDAAREESLLTLKLLFSFLDAGISLPLALETLNEQLLMRCGDEIFATLDLCIIDLSSGVTQISKLAACRTIILRGGEMLRIDGGCLPLGIVERVQPQLHRLRLRPGDLLLMGSDGLMEAGEMHLAEHALRQSAALPPKQIAEELVRRAHMALPENRRDDLTCICVRVDSAQ